MDQQVIYRIQADLAKTILNSAPINGILNTQKLYIGIAFIWKVIGNNIRPPA